ncbi:MAG: FKBP-type peptidyl-prolyl cis-trans isomerase [Lachnospiraceae bacterium]|nr:FKBP-type peptidyl-prolyl cis-trans isomerase [Lachnospiraceae bacterium]MBR4816566.1 FKBP-type peptidyl-prolyl cis-trans isomerase [Lachnospiraceae bacterium]
MGNENKYEGMSLSKQRKLERQAEIAKKKQQAVIIKVVVALVVLAIVGLCVWAIIKKMNKVEANYNFSEQIDNNGMIKGVKAGDYVTMVDYNNLTAPLSEIEYPDEKVEESIKTQLDNHKAISTSTDIVAKNGDKVNIDFAGTVDGEAFDGGTSTAYDLTLGSNSFIDDFEAQIEGHKPGDSFDVEVTFPTDYGTATLAGKDAVFAVKLNGIYVAPEFTDEFVQEYLSDYATTAEGYRQYLKDTNYKNNLITYVEKYVVANSTFKSFPSAYFKQMKGNYKANEIAKMEYYNQLYESYLGGAMYASFEEYLSKAYSQTEEEFDNSIEERVSDTVKYAIFCQAVAEKEGITATIDEVKEYYISNGGTEDNFNSQIENYGQGYLVQQYLDQKVRDFIVDKTTVQ